MARHAISPIPAGYTIITISGRHYPLKVEMHGDIPHAHGFLHLGDNTVVSYSKRMYAIDFLHKFDTSGIAWARVTTERQGEVINHA